ncbi:HNH endonuclease [Mycobacterium phage Adawi]|uniref:HNH endonuclease n=1 Tax=Mycobacterium phage Adawi TaxID=1354507 RepID=T2A822_9CAUD|nr:HNH endonuclease [Mycobacterium phage Adawi]AGU91990.1 HNH endonuclease [Mycobacterium phage Adawi]
MPSLGERQYAAIRTLELRHGVAIGLPTRAEVMPRPQEGRHARLSMRVRSTGDQWVLMIKDQTGPGKHRPGFPRFNLDMTLAEIAARDAGCIT